jgi:hypothetical protein
MLSKLPWPEKVKVWEMHYLKETPIDRIRWEVKKGEPAPSWETVKQVVSEFLSLTPSQLTTLPSALQARWGEVVPQKDTGHKETKEVVHHRRKHGRQRTVPDRATVLQIIQRWRLVLESFSPTRLLERELAEASKNAVGEFFSDEGEKEADRRAHQHHSVEMMPQLKADPVYASLREGFPDPAVLTALDVSLDAWGQSVPPYMSAYFDMMRQLDDWVRQLVSSISDEQTTDNVNLSVYISKYRRQTAYAVLIACDLLTRGLSELPDNIYWALLHNSLEKLRVRANLELSSLTNKTRKGGWPSNAGLIWDEPGDPSGLATRTRNYLSELSKLQSAHDSLEQLLQKLESKLWIDEEK